jgi:site-specific DNA-methyltransferase (adenine-specific)
VASWRIERSDAVRGMASLESGSVDLCYLDPPFGTGRTHAAARGRFADAASEPHAYEAFMRPWIDAIHRVLTPHGIVLLHCDWRHVHRLRLWLEERFGAEGFVNHIVWRYGLGGSSARRFARKHDDILFFAKGSEYFFEPPRVPATSARLRGRMKKATDVLDVPSLNNMAHERCGWPTQKPLQLLDLLVRACCRPGGLVLDPCFGSGTSLIAAVASGRRARGFDVDPAAVAVAEDRLRSLDGEPRLRTRT